MTKSQANKEGAVDAKLLTLPADAGRAIVEDGAVIACPICLKSRELWRLSIGSLRHQDWKRQDYGLRI